MLSCSYTFLVLIFFNFMTVVLHPFHRLAVLLFSVSCPYHVLIVDRRPPAKVVAYWLRIVEYMTVLAPIITAKQVTGKSLIIEIPFCKFGQVHLLYLFVGKIFLVLVFAYIIIVQAAYKVVYIFLGQLTVSIVAPYQECLFSGFVHI